MKRRGLRRRDRAALAAIADAMIPGASGPVVAGAVSRFLAGVPARQRGLVVLALRAVEWLSGARPLSRLPVAERVRRLERLSGNLLARDLVVLLKALVAFGWARDPRAQAGLGIRPVCELAPGAEAPGTGVPALATADMSLPDTDVEHCDVVVVGSGAGGATAARVLAESGLAVVVLEEGELHDAASYTTDPLTALGAMYRDGGLTVLEGRPAIPLPLGRCVGGTTVINSGTCVRTPPDLLMRWRDELGMPWATELEDEFEAVERDLAVMPVDPTVAGANAAVCRRGAAALGASNGPVSRNAGAVVRCGTCPTGCAIDAKQAMHVSELPRAVAAGARIRAGARVEKVIVQGGRATGVAVRRPDGRPYAVAARAVVLAAGAIGTPELLLRHGIGGPATGHNLHVQPACWVGGVFDEEIRGWEGVMQSWHIDEWCPRGLFLEATFTPLPFGAHWLPGIGAAFKERLAQFGRLAVIGVHLADRSSGRVRSGRRGTRLTYRLTRADAAELGFGIARAADVLFAAGAREVFPQVAGVQTIRPGEQARLEGGIAPSRLRLEAFHPMGTARIGTDPGSVVGADGELRGVPGLYVADGSLLPTALGVNPMITILAVARRVARDLAARLG